jgi:hypothetical protein
MSQKRRSKRPAPEKPTSRNLDERHALPVEDPEAALEALLRVDPEAKAKLTEEEIEAAVRAAISDPDVDAPPPKNG